MSVARDQLLERAIRFQARGRTHYHDSRLRDTARSLGRACRLARAAGPDGVDLEDECRFWMGAALHGAGRLPEALAAWAPSVNRLADHALTGDRYMALTRYLLVAVDIPLPLVRIETAFEEAETRLRQSVGGLGGLRSRILLARARLAQYRGQWPEALELAQEGLARRRTEARAYTYSTHYRVLVDACLRAGELDLIPDYLDEWEGVNDGYPDTRRILVTAATANYLRALGDPEGALERAAGIEAEIHRCEDVSFQVEAGSAFVRACLATGVPDRARSVMARLARHRTSLIGEIRFDTRLLLAEFNLARPRRAVAAARREAKRLDALLACDRHAVEVGDRL